MRPAMERLFMRGTFDWWLRSRSARLLVGGAARELRGDPLVRRAGSLALLRVRRGGVQGHSEVVGVRHGRVEGAEVLELVVAEPTEVAVVHRDRRGRGGVVG